LEIYPIDQQCFLKEVEKLTKLVASDARKARIISILTVRTKEAKFSGKIHESYFQFFTSQVRRLTNDPRMELEDEESLTQAIYELSKVQDTEVL